MKLIDLPRVLVLDDDAELRGLLIRVLQRDGFAVTAVDTIAAFNHALAQGGADVCVLDWALRGEDGWLLAQRLGHTPGAPPVLMLSAKAALAERIQGLSAADDYLAKPFEPTELVARLRALLRRRGVQGDQRLVFGPFTLDFARRCLCLHETPLDLSAGEWQLLAHLALQPGRVFSRVQLLSVLGESADDAGERAVDVRLSRLRKKLGHHAGMIETVWGEGYRFTPPQAPGPASPAVQGHV